MAELHLVLAPHEMEPHRQNQYEGEPFSFQTEWNGARRDFIGKVFGQQVPMIFFALADEPERGNFVSASSSTPSDADLPSPSSYEPCDQIPAAAAYLIRWLELTADDRWVRLFYVDEEFCPALEKPIRWQLFLGQRGWGQWRGAPDFYQEHAFFCWNSNPDAARELALRPPLELLEHVRPSLLDPQSDAAFARRFASFSSTNNTRFKICRPLERGDYEEWELVLRLFLRSRGAFWTGEEGRLHLILNKRLSPPFGTDGWGIEGNSCLLSEQAANFCEWTQAYFAPTIDQELISRCSAAAVRSRGSFVIHVHARRPTQHERLEALLQLREWMSDKATPNEIEALLREE